MINPFPHLLYYSFFAPTLLRLCAGLWCIYLSYLIGVNKQLHAKISSRAPQWVSTLYAVVVALVGIALCIGMGTQWAALGAVAIAVVEIYALRHSQAISRSTLIFFLIICLSLLLTGAGGRAVDIPL